MGSQDAGTLRDTYNTKVLIQADSAFLSKYEQVFGCSGRRFKESEPFKAGRIKFVYTKGLGGEYQTPDLVQVDSSFLSELEVEFRNSGRRFPESPPMKFGQVEHTEYQLDHGPHHNLSLAEMDSSYLRGFEVEYGTGGKRFDGYVPEMPIMTFGDFDIPPLSELELREAEAIRHNIDHGAIPRSKTALENLLHRIRMLGLEEDLEFPVLNALGEYVTDPAAEYKRPVESRSKYDSDPYSDPDLFLTDSSYLRDVNLGTCGRRFKESDPMKHGDSQIPGLDGVRQQDQKLLELVFGTGSYSKCDKALYVLAIKLGLDTAAKEWIPTSKDEFDKLGEAIEEIQDIELKMDAQINLHTLVSEETQLDDKSKRESFSDSAYSDGSDFSDTEMQDSILGSTNQIIEVY